MSRRGGRRGESGQVLVILAFGMVAMLAMTGLIVDGGQAYARQRMTQNATDAAAEAGAIVLLKVLMGEPRTDADVLAAVTSTLAVNDAQLAAAEYTDASGASIGVTVGAAPDGAIPAVAAGVAVTGRQTFGTYFAGIVGIRTLSTTTDAAAAAGVLDDTCTVAAGCTLVPLGIPATSLTCDAGGTIVAGTNPWPTDGTIVEIPLCRPGAGNVGWIDWHPPSGGTAELADSILRPDNPDMTFPDWFLVGASGNVNSGQIETALRSYRDETVIIPLFSASCDRDPGDDASGAARTCSTGAGNGQNLWYLLTGYVGFRLCGPATSGCLTGAHGDVSGGAYITGNPPQCSVGHGTSCLFGRFEEVVLSGSIDAGGGGTGGAGTSSGGIAVGVQLVR